MYVFVLRVQAQDFYCNAPLVYRSYCKRGTTKLMIIIIITSIFGVGLQNRQIWHDNARGRPLLDHRVAGCYGAVVGLCSKFYSR